MDEHLAMDRPVYFGGGRAFDFAFACDRATSGAAKPGNGASLSRARREGPRAGDPCNVARCAEHWRLNSGAFNLAALNSDQVRLTFLGHATSLIESPQLVRIAYRLQRLRQITAGAGHRHHEPCARHALHRPSRSGDQIRAARLGRDPRSAGQLGPEIS